MGAGAVGLVERGGCWSGGCEKGVSGGNCARLIMPGVKGASQMGHPQKSDKVARLARKVLHDGDAVRISLDHVRFPNGREVRDHYLFELKRPSVCAVMDDASGRVLLVKVYRYPCDSWQWELPAGGAEDGESPLEAVQRELLEETGYRAARYEEWTSFYPLHGVSDHQFHVFHCRAVEKVGAFDTGEVSEIRWVNADEISTMIQDKILCGSHSLIGLLMWLARSKTPAVLSDKGNQ